MTLTPEEIAEGEAMTEIEAGVWELIQLARGRSQAISRASLSDHLRADDRSVRTAINSLVINYKKPIMSDYHHGGYFLPSGEEEVVSYVKTLSNHTLSMMRRLAVFKKVTLQELMAEYQTELPP